MLDNNRKKTDRLPMVIEQITALDGCSFNGSPS
jgi:hypothetical protein